MANVAVEIEYLVTRLDPITGEFKSLVSLKEVDGKRVYMIQILPEKCVLLDYLKDSENDIPIEIPFVSAYTLIRELISSIGLSLNSFIITGQDLANRMITSQLVLHRGEEVINFNIRTVTDGIVIAIQNNIPILISEELLLNPDENELYQLIKKMYDKHTNSHSTSDDESDMTEFLRNMDDSKMSKH